MNGRTRLGVKALAELSCSQSPVLLSSFSSLVPSIHFFIPISLLQQRKREEEADRSTTIGVKREEKRNWPKLKLLPQNGTRVWA